MRRQKSARKDFQVALLMDDVAEAKNISDGLREIGIYAHFYQDLDELWVSLNAYTPDLCIVDVKKMSQGTLLFRNHPKVKNNILKYAFYYKNATQVLLNSTFGMNHYGLIRAELNLVDQLKSVLMRRNEELRLLEQVDSMQTRVERLKRRSVRLNEEHENYEAWKNRIAQADELVHKFGYTASMGEFNQRLIYLFSQWTDCLEFGVYHLNSTNQKLVSVNAHNPKYINLPDLWLSTACEKGITQYAREMAFDVAYGLMDGDLVTLHINGMFDEPSMILVGSFNANAVKDFNWSAIENKLSNEYRKILLNQSQGEKEVNHLESLHTTLQNLDDIHFHQVDVTHRYALVDFANLVQMIKQRSANRFHWKTFATEFMNGLTELLSGNFKISYYGTEAFLVGIERKHIETDFNKLKSFVEDFQFWRYFEDSSLVVSHDLTPQVRFVAPSSVNVIRQMQDGLSDFMQTESNVQMRRPHIEV